MSVNNLIICQLKANQEKAGGSESPQAVLSGQVLQVSSLLSNKGLNSRDTDNQERSKLHTSNC